MPMAPIAPRLVLGSMKTIDALNFFLVGLVMFFCPAYWPEEFCATASSESSSELWLLVMGAVQLSVGAWSMAVNIVPRAIRHLAEWEPVMFEFKLMDAGWFIPESLFVGLEEGEEVAVALSLPPQLRLAYA